MTIVSGPDADGLAEALVDRGVDVARIEGPTTREKLLGAGIEGADTFVLTDADDATAIAVAKDDNPEVRVVLYAEDSLPEFARGQADLAVDPALLSPDVVAEELVEAA
jgi:voltage-gated potassium channel Kch